jgi:hypothetical protein
MRNPVSGRRIGRRSAILGAAAILVVGCGSSSPTSTAAAPRPSATATPQPSPPTTPTASAEIAIPEGRYVSAPQLVADILGRLDRETALSASEKQAITDQILGIRGARSFKTAFEVDASNHVVVFTTVDERSPSAERDWTITAVDRDTVVLDPPCCVAEVYGVRRIGGSFTLEARSPASSNVEAFVRRVVFETEPFRREL